MANKRPKPEFFDFDDSADLGVSIILCGEYALGVTPEIRQEIRKAGERFAAELHNLLRKPAACEQLATSQTKPYTRREG